MLDAQPAMGELEKQSIRRAYIGIREEAINRSKRDWLKTCIILS
jgi:hypothetical protein